MQPDGEAAGVSGKSKSGKLSKIFSRVALGTKMQLATNASQVEKFQDKASKNASLMSKVEQAASKVEGSTTTPRVQVLCPQKSNDKGKISSNVIAQPSSGGLIQVSRRQPGSLCTTDFECKVVDIMMMIRDN